MSLSTPPISAPICPGDKNSDAWAVYLQKAFTAQAKGSAPQTITATGSTETMRVVHVGALLHYSYTGKGGVSFDYEGTQISIPATPDVATTASTLIVGG